MRDPCGTHARRSASQLGSQGEDRPKGFDAWANVVQDMVVARKTSTTLYLEEQQLEELRALSAQQRVPMAVLIREALRRMLASGPWPAGAPDG